MNGGSVNWPQPNMQPPPVLVPELGCEGMLAGGDRSGVKVSQTGNSEELGLIGTGGMMRRVTLLNAQGVDALGLVNTIGLFLQRTGITNVDDNINASFPVKAVIKFGQAGAQFEVECDFINGMILSLPGSFIRLDAVIDLPDASLAQLVTYPLTAAAMLLYLPMGQRARPTQRTIVIPTLAAKVAPGDTLIVAVPKFAQSVSFFSDVAATTSFNVAQCSDPAGANVLAFAPALQAVPPSFLEWQLVNGCRFLKVQNNTGVNVNAKAVFNLSL